MPDRNDAIDHFVERAGSLYSLPAVAMKVLELTNNPQVDAAALKRCIENDPALTTKVLKVVNGSLFGLSGEVRDLNQALALLGIKPLKLLVLGFSLPERLFSGVAADVLGYYWRRTLTKAIAGREIADVLWKHPGDEVFIAGLLADLGMLVLLQDLGEPYVKFLERVRDENGDLLALESDVLGFDHTMLSARLLERWGLPESITAAIAMPQSVATMRRLSYPEGVVPQILHLAELLAQLVAEHRINALPELLEAGAAYHQITRDQFTTLVETLEEKVRGLADVLSLELPEGMDYRDVLIEAHKRLSLVAEDASGHLARCKMDETEVCDELLSVSRSLSEAAQRAARRPRSEEDCKPREPAPAVAAAAVEAGAKQPATAPAEQGAADAAAGACDVDAAFLRQLRTAVANCRQARCGLSLLVAEIDRFEELVKVYGAETAAKMSALVAAAARTLDHTHVELVRTRESGYAVILEDCERRQAVELGGHLVRMVRQLAQGGSQGAARSITASVGAAAVALPPKNFPAENLVESAERCLYGAQASGGSTVKSIEIY